MGAWVFFRLETLPDALAYIGVLAGVRQGEVPPYLTIDLFTLEHRLTFIAAILACVPWRPATEGVGRLAGRPIAWFTKKRQISYSKWLVAGGQLLDVAILMSILILSIMHIAVGTYNPFIYFRF